MARHVIRHEIGSGDLSVRVVSSVSSTCLPLVLRDVCFGGYKRTSHQAIRHQNGNDDTNVHGPISSHQTERNHSNPKNISAANPAAVGTVINQAAMMPTKCERRTSLRRGRSS